MTAPRVRAGTRGAWDVAGAARELLAAMALEPAGRVTSSVYETGRLVTLAPWLTGHARRLDHLLDNQRGDGGWGGRGGYALIPTLSAVEALLATVRAGTKSGRSSGALVGAAGRGLHALSGWLGSAGPSIPDTPAADLIVPALVGGINDHLDWFGDRPGVTGGVPMVGGLPLPAGMGRRRLEALLGLLASGRPVPQKLLHAFEVLGPAARGRRDVSLAAGTIGASPAATAAWLGDPAAAGADPAALAYLETAVGQHGGPVPCCTPITAFERAWVLSSLARAGVPLHPAPKLVAELAAVLGPEGTPTSPGLPADADTTSVTLYALARAGHPVDPSSLFRYDLGDHFCTWQGEDGYSVTTNAHVLEALGWHARHAGPGPDVPRSRVDALAGWLRDLQKPDGRWSDRWHASPYYATTCVVLALDRYAPAAVGAPAVDRAVDWVLATQHTDGSWGRWSGTAEETAYALHVLLGVGRPTRAGVPESARRGLAYLAERDGREDDVSLWHDKDLYTPVLIVRAAIIAVGQLARARSDLLTMDGAGPLRPMDERRMIRSA